MNSGNRILDELRGSTLENGPNWQFRRFEGVPLGRQNCHTTDWELKIVKKCHLTRRQTQKLATVYDGKLVVPAIFIGVTL